MSSQISLRRGFEKNKIKWLTAAQSFCWTWPSPSVYSPRRALRTTVSPHPTTDPEERMVSAWTILETGEKLLPEIIPVPTEWWHEWYFFPEWEWEAAAGWCCFSLTNTTVTHRSHRVPCVFQTSAKGQLQRTQALLFLPQIWRDVLVNQAKLASSKIFTLERNIKWADS